MISNNFKVRGYQFCVKKLDFKVISRELNKEKEKILIEFYSFELLWSLLRVF